MFFLVCPCRNFALAPPAVQSLTGRSLPDTTDTSATLLTLRDKVVLWLFYKMVVTYHAGPLVSYNQVIRLGQDFFRSRFTHAEIKEALKKAKKLLPDNLFELWPIDHEAAWTTMKGNNNNDRAQFQSDFKELIFQYPTAECLHDVELEVSTIIRAKPHSKRFHGIKAWYQDLPVFMPYNKLEQGYQEHPNRIIHAGRISARLAEIAEFEGTLRMIFYTPASEPAADAIPLDQHEALTDIANAYAASSPIEVLIIGRNHSQTGWCALYGKSVECILLDKDIVSHDGAVKNNQSKIKRGKIIPVTVKNISHPIHLRYHRPTPN
ncbi:MAG: hypothetical protein GF384_05400, partial [Elusimicrobia bacterium]|nr:hypothetical protein [Elusimicrobiota bacterium]MBD3412216.1 hypothetical protein [Elusimicrobiota bacterium]